jgi:hypothetical protein
LEEWMMTTRKTLGYLLILIKKYRVHTWYEILTYHTVQQF